jgi:hypothetical protein
VSGFVYFIGPHPRHRCVKIGHTNGAIAKRMAGLQTGSPWPLQVYAYLRGGRDLERELHETFAPLRLTGEWFVWDHKLAAFTDRLEPHCFGRRAPTTRELVRAFYREVMRAAPFPEHPTNDPIAWRASANIAPLARKWGLA